jgi:hypothetical protein
MRPEYGVAGLWISQLRPSAPRVRVARLRGSRSQMARERFCKGAAGQGSTQTSARDARAAGYARPTSEIAFEPENKGFCDLSLRRCAIRCRSYDLRWTANPSPVSIELRDSDVADGDMTMMQQLTLLIRLAHHFCRGVVASAVDSVPMEMREGENWANRLLAQRSAC